MKHKVCSQCVLDTSDPDIFFDRHGVCNYCQEVARRVKEDRKHPEFPDLEAIVNRLKLTSTGQYDCLVGVSGGVDSSYVVHLAKELGLNPLLVHCDNGWNSPLAIKNIHALIEKSGFDYQTIVLDWDEIRDLQRAFLKSSVIDIDMVTDHAISATVFGIARKNNIKYLLTGNNDATENCMPPSWYWRKSDRRNLLSIHKQFGEVPLKDYPMIGPASILFYRNTRWGPTPIDILNYVDFNKKDAITVLQDIYGWEYYGGKHYESTFTKFYQAHILPTKFNVDKRKAHYSSLIRNGEMDRDEALRALESPDYDADALADDQRFFLEKLGFTEEEFDRILAASPIPHEYYGTDQRWYDFVKRWVV